MSDRIKEAITEHWGERCPDYEPGCWCCDVWAEYDAMQAQAARIAELEAALKTARADALEDAASLIRRTCQTLRKVGYSGFAESVMAFLPHILAMKENSNE